MGDLLVFCDEMLTKDSNLVVNGGGGHKPDMCRVSSNLPRSVMSQKQDGYDETHSDGL